MAKKRGKTKKKEPQKKKKEKAEVPEDKSLEKKVETDEKNELRLSRISVIVHTFLGVAAGWLSNYVGDMLYGVGIMIVLLLISGYVSEKLVNKKGIKWWLANGGIIYIFLWFISWVYFLNMV